MDPQSKISRRWVRAAIDVVFDDTEVAVAKLLPYSNLAEGEMLRRILEVTRYQRRMLYDVLKLEVGEKATKKGKGLKPGRRI